MFLFFQCCILSCSRVFFAVIREPKSFVFSRVPWCSLRAVLCCVPSWSPRPAFSRVPVCSLVFSKPCVLMQCLRASDNSCALMRATPSSPPHATISSPSSLKPPTPQFCIHPLPIFILSSRASLHSLLIPSSSSLTPHSVLLFPLSSSWAPLPSLISSPSPLSPCLEPFSLTSSLFPSFIPTHLITRFFLSPPQYVIYRYIAISYINIYIAFAPPLSGLMCPDTVEIFFYTDIVITGINLKPCPTVSVRNPSG